VGEVRSYPSDFRLITATSRDLRVLVEGGQFRRDLFHRVAWHTVEIPPLRERREDIPALVRAFLSATPQHRDGTVFGIAREALEYLEGLAWEGNVRELRGVVEAACAGARHMVTVSDVRDVVRVHEGFLSAPGGASASPAGPPASASPPEPTAAPAATGDAAFENKDYRDLTAAYYHFLMRKTGGRLAEVARLAGISKTTAYEWKDRYGEGDG
jgi:DNA-binding NtrC family response regulator